MEFLPVHRLQAEETRKRIAAAENQGRLRRAANHLQVLESLERIIPALAAVREETTRYDVQP